MNSQRKLCSLLLILSIALAPAMQTAQAAEIGNDGKSAVVEKDIESTIPLEMRQEVKTALKNYNLKQLMAEKAAEASSRDEHHLMIFLASVGGGALIGALIDGGDGAARGAFLGGIVGGVYVLSMRW